MASRPVLNKGAIDLVKVDIVFSNEKQHDSLNKTGCPTGRKSYKNLSR